jgi:hypothetical protein
MTPESRRRLTVLDAMILVALSAVGFTTARFADDLLYGRYDPSWRGSHEPIRLINKVGESYTFVLVLMLGLMILRMLPPRPSRRRLWSQPGIAACLGSWVGCVAMTGAWSKRLLLDFYWVTKSSRHYWNALLANRAYIFLADEAHLFLYELALIVPAGICSAWLILWLGGRMRRPADWIDRTGLILGLWCLGSYLFAFIWQFFEQR